VSFLVALLFPKRLGRASYFIRSCATSLLVWGLVAGSLPNESDAIATILLLLACVYYIFWVALPRMRDISMRPFWLILLLVPVLNGVLGLVLVFRPSTIALPKSADTPEKSRGWRLLWNRFSLGYLLYARSYSASFQAPTAWRPSTVRIFAGSKNQSTLERCQLLGLTRSYIEYSFLGDGGVQWL
jgi:uncharacterized membrane protein YhaH (DUF805 family)